MVNIQLMYTQAMAMTTSKQSVILILKTSLVDVATTRSVGEEEMTKVALFTKYMAAWAMISLDLQPRVLVL